MVAGIFKQWNLFIKVNYLQLLTLWVDVTVYRAITTIHDPLEVLEVWRVCVRSIYEPMAFVRKIKNLSVYLRSYETLILSLIITYLSSA